MQIARKLELRERKTGKARIIPLNDRVRAALGEYLRGRPGLLPEDPLFPSRKREEGGGMRPIFRQQAWHVLHRAAEEAGLLDRNGRVGSHTMRKTFALALGLAVVAPAALADSPMFRGGPRHAGWPGSGWPARWLRRCPRPGRNRCRKRPSPRSTRRWSPIT